MHIMFKLKMSKIGSWNGVWTGERKFYVIVREFSTKTQYETIKKILSRKNYYYDFGDGWEAKITQTKLKSRMDAIKVSNDSKGFCGYEWMVSSIILNGKIINP